MGNTLVREQAMENLLLRGNGKGNSSKRLPYLLVNKLYL